MARRLEGRRQKAMMTIDGELVVKVDAAETGYESMGIVTCWLPWGAVRAPVDGRKTTLVQGAAEEGRHRIQITQGKTMALA